MKNEIVRNTVVMTVITFISGLLLGTVYQVTAAPIAAQKEKAQQEAYEAVMPGASFSEIEGFDEDAAQEVLDSAGYEDDSITGVVAAKGSDGSSSGYVLNVTAGGGYGGNILFSMGIDNKGSITGVSITEISETPGLGMKAKTDSAFISQFVGKDNTQFDLGSDVQGITSATFTSRAITKGINAGLEYYRSLGGGQ